MYVVVRRDLPVAQVTVQAIHGALESARAFPHPKIHPNAIVLTVEDETALNELRERLRRAYVPFVSWREPDLNDSLTSVSSAPLYGAERKHFRGLPLLKGE